MNHGAEARTRPRTGSFTPLYKLTDSPIQLHSKAELALGDRSVCTCKAQAKVFPLLPEFELQDKTLKRYLNYQQRAYYKVNIDESLFYNARGQYLHGKLIAVMLPDHTMYAGPPDVILNHSNLCAGLPVLFAGFLYFYEGRLISISNNSGHYKPELSNIKHAFEWLYEHSENKPFIVEDHTNWRNGITWQRIEDVLTGQLKPLEKEALRIHIHSFVSIRANDIFTSQPDPDLDSFFPSLPDEAYYETYPDDFPNQEKDAPIKPESIERVQLPNNVYLYNYTEFYESTRPGVRRFGGQPKVKSTTIKPPT